MRQSLRGGGVRPERAIDLEEWLYRGVLAARRGDVMSARRIFRALSRLAPDEQRVWIGLARVAATSTERVEALHRAEALVAAPLWLPPELHRSGQGVAYETTPPFAENAEQALTTSGVVSLSSSAEALPSPAIDRGKHDRRNRSFGWYAPAMLLLSVVGVFALWWWLRQMIPSPPITLLPSPNVPPTVAAIGPLPNPRATGLIAATLSLPTPSPVLPTPSPPPTLTPEPDMRALGRLIAYDQWYIGLLRQEDVVLIDGALGAIQSNGRLLIALLAVSNEASFARALPADRFAVEDERGQRYSPLAEASRRYLDQFGRGLYGDLALEDTFTPQSGLRSVPVLFDLPTDRVPVRLWVGDEGWSLRREGE